MFEHILVPLDGSRLGPQAINYATDVARHYGAEITLFQAVSRIEEANVTSAILGGKWNMMTQRMIVNEENSRETAFEFMKNSATFQYDGIENSLELAETLYPDIENIWQFVYRFDSRHARYGDRTEEMIAQIITPHDAIVTVGNGVVKSAILDTVRNMLELKMM